MSGRPLDVLEASLGERVTVRLKSGDEYVGDLAGYDQHMNLVLDDVTIPARSRHRTGSRPKTQPLYAATTSFRSLHDWCRNPEPRKENKTTHVKCRRCGEKSYHVKRRSARRGFGKSAKRRDYEWQSKPATTELGQRFSTANCEPNGYRRVCGR